MLIVIVYAVVWINDSLTTAMSDEWTSESIKREVDSCCPYTLGFNGVYCLVVSVVRLILIIQIHDCSSF